MYIKKKIIINFILSLFTDYFSLSNVELLEKMQKPSNQFFKLYHSVNLFCLIFAKLFHPNLKMFVLLLKALF